jgi:hypothetical protein
MSNADANTHSRHAARVQVQKRCDAALGPIIENQLARRSGRTHSTCGAPLSSSYFLRPAPVREAKFWS